LEDCGTKLNHAVLAVGYDEDSLIIKNSWGTDWGLDGFIRIKHGNTCGVYEDMVVITE
jgi:C1A family cysteine protease